MGDIKIVVRALPELVSVLISWATLVTLFLLLKKLLYKPVTKILDERKAKIESDINEAKDLKEEAETLKLDYESRIDSAKQESQKIIEAARKRGEDLREEIIAKANKDAESIISRARLEINREKKAAYEDIKGEIGELAILVASKIIEEEVNLNKQSELIDKFINEVGSSQWQN